MGSKFRVTQSRGKWLESPIDARVMATIHPSAILRAPDEDARAAMYQEFLRDISLAARG
jgi:DNA polymerase